MTCTGCATAGKLGGLYRSAVAPRDAASINIALRVQ